MGKRQRGRVPRLKVSTAEVTDSVEASVEAPAEEACGWALWNAFAE